MLTKQNTQKSHKTKEFKQEIKKEEEELV